MGHHKPGHNKGPKPSPSPPPSPSPSPSPTPVDETVLTKTGPNWFINGEIVHAGRPFVEGQLLNSRMVQGIFDAEVARNTNPDNYKYPGTTSWQRPRDPDRNVSELIAQIPTYKSYGLDMITVCMQGGATGLKTTGGYFIGGKGITAWNADGSIKPAWKTRLVNLLKTCDQYGIVVNLQCFYHSRDDVLTDEAAVFTAMHNLIDIILDPSVSGEKHFKNVLFEIMNETSGHNASHPALWNNLATTITNLKNYVSSNYAGKTLYFSFSQPGGSLPPADLRGVIDYYSLHGNGQDPARIRNMVDSVRSHANYNKQPIMFTEDSTSLANMTAAVEDRSVSWGYYDQGNPQTALGQADYNTGFQSPPVNWEITTTEKQAFFDKVKVYVDPPEFP
jgi:hypothetical protein